MNIMGILLVIIASFMWAFVPILTGMLKDSIDPTVLSFYRMGLASIMILIVYLMRKEKPGIIKPFILLLLAAGLGKSGNYILMNWGIKLSGVASTVIVLPTQTLFTLLFSVVILKKRIKYSVWMMAILVIAGITMVSWNGNRLDSFFNAKYFYGNLLLLSSGIFSGIYLVIQKYLSGKMNSQTVLLFAFTAGTLLSFLAAEKSRMTYNLTFQNWVVLLILSCIVTGIGYYVLAEGMKKASIVVSAIILNMSIALTVILDILFLGEKISAYIVIGLIIALIGSIGINYLEIKSGGDETAKKAIQQ